MKQLTLSFLLILLPLMASADKVEIDGIWYNIIAETNEAEVTYPLTLYSGDIIIPDKIVYNGTDYFVTKIGDTAFWHYPDVTSITIGKNVTSIGGYAFEGCTSLTSITIPSSVRSIGIRATKLCTNLTTICLLDLEKWCQNPPSGIPIANTQHLYVNDEEITDLVIPNSVTSIGPDAFNSFVGLSSVSIPSNVTTIGESAFAWCKGLTSVSIANGVTTIGDYSFNGCGGITSITIPNSVTSIGECSFRKCTSLTSVTIPKNLSTIEYCAFSGCSNLTSVTIPSSVTSIGFHAFEECSNLTSILSLNSIPPSCSTSFLNINKNSCTVWVPKGSFAAYKASNEWNELTIKEIINGDVNLDGQVDVADINAFVAYIIGEASEGLYEEIADLNGDNKIDAADIVLLINMVK